MADNEIPAEDIESTTTVDEVSAAEPDQKPDVPVEVKRALAKANKEAETLRLKLKEFEDRDKTEAEKLQDELNTLRSEREQLSLEKLRREVADEKGLTPAQARRLVGSTRDELEADADDVLATFPIKAKPVFGDVGQGTRTESAQRVYTAREIGDFSFFQKHKDDILAAQREGRITFD